MEAALAHMDAAVTQVDAAIAHMGATLSHMDVAIVHMGATLAKLQISGISAHGGSLQALQVHA